MGDTHIYKSIIIMLKRDWITFSCSTTVELKMFVRHYSLNQLMKDRQLHLDFFLRPEV